MNELTVLEVIVIICVVNGFLLVVYLGWALVCMSRDEMPEIPDESQDEIDKLTCNKPCHICGANEGQLHDQACSYAKAINDNR